jgi:hypothetical protein
MSRAAFPLLYQVWSPDGSDEDLGPLTHWWAGRHSKSMVGAGFLGAHQYEAVLDVRRPLCNLYELPDMDVFGDVYHAATMDDLKYLDVSGDKYGEEELQKLASSGSTATIYDQLAIYGSDGSSQAPGLSIGAALAAPCVSLFGFASNEPTDTIARFDSTFRGGPPDGCGAYINVRLCRHHARQHPISPLPPEHNEWLVLAQWPNRAVGEQSHASLLRAISAVSGSEPAERASNLVINGVSRLNSSAWGI